MIISEQQVKINNAKNVYEIMKRIYDKRPEEERHKEHFYIIGLNNKNIISYIDLVSIGTVNACVPVIRECLRLAIVKNALSIIAVHNHPSGVTTPSTQDNVFTKRLKEAGDLIEVKLLDHIIVGDLYFSYADSGVI